MTSEHHAHAVLATVVKSTINRAIQDQRRHAETLNEQTVKDGTAAGFVDLDGAGETTVEVTFPLQFFERPLFVPGLELTGNSYLEWGSFPDWSATVAAWRTQTISETVLYIGALIAVRARNINRAALHYSFTGRIFTNPAGPDDSVEAPQ